MKPANLPPVAAAETPDASGAFLFVYGTLRRAAGHPMHRLLVAHARFAGTASYAGRLYDVGPYPAVVPDPAAHPPVTGELYALPDPRTLLPPLDRYEGCTEGDDRAGEYRRVRQPVTRQDGTTVSAWIYLYNRSTGPLRRIPGGDYLQPHPPETSAR